MDGLNNLIREQVMNHKYEVVGIDFFPKEKETNEKVYGAIWFDREAVKNDILREPGIDGEMIVLIDDGNPGDGSFRYLFSLIGASGVKWEPNIKVGALYQLVGNMIGGGREGKGTIEFAPLGESTAASLGFLSEFGYDENGQLIKL